MAAEPSRHPPAIRARVIDRVNPPYLVDFHYAVNFVADTADLVIYGVVGLIAGFLASRTILRKGQGFVLDAGIGIAGAFLGTFLSTNLGIKVDTAGGPVGSIPYLDKILVAFVGAIIVLLVVRVIGNTRGA